MSYLVERRREVSKLPQTLRVPSCEVVIVAENQRMKNQSVVVDLLASLGLASEHISEYSEGGVPESEEGTSVRRLIVRSRPPHPGRCSPHPLRRLWKA